MEEHLWEGVYRDKLCVAGLSVLKNSYDPCMHSSSQVCKEQHRFEKLMEYFRNEDSNIDFMVRNKTGHPLFVKTWACTFQRLCLCQKLPWVWWWEEGLQYILYLLNQMVSHHVGRFRTVAVPDHAGYTGLCKHNHNHTHLQFILCKPTKPWYSIKCTRVKYIGS